MKSLIEKLFYANICLDDLSETLGYEEEEILNLLENPDELVDEEIEILSFFFNEERENLFK